MASGHMDLCFNTEACHTHKHTQYFCYPLTNGFQRYFRSVSLRSGGDGEMIEEVAGSMGNGAWVQPLELEER